MNEAARIKKLIQNIADHERPALFSAKVKSVSGDTCTVQIGKLELTDVRLRAICNGKSDTLRITPKEGSIVLLADLSDGGMRDLVVIQYSEIDEVFIKIDETEFKMNKDGYAMNRNGESLKKILLEFIGEVKNIFVVQGTTPNIPNLTILENNVKTLLK